MSKPDQRFLRQVETEFDRAFASRQNHPDPFVPGYTYGRKPIPDEHGEVPLSLAEELSRVAPCGYVVHEDPAVSLESYAALYSDFQGAIARRREVEDRNELLRGKLSTAKVILAALWAVVMMLVWEMGRN